MFNTCPPYYWIKNIHQWKIIATDFPAPQILWPEPCKLIAVYLVASLPLIVESQMKANALWPTYLKMHVSLQLASNKLLIEGQNIFLKHIKETIPSFFHWLLYKMLKCEFNSTSPQISWSWWKYQVVGNEK